MIKSLIIYINNAKSPKKWAEQFFMQERRMKFEQQNYMARRVRRLQKEEPSLKGFGR
jgi:hypothetical protein